MSKHPAIGVLIVALIVALAAVAPAAAQSAAPVERPPLGSTLTVDALADLPSGGNLFTLLDTVVPEVITDRVDTGGLSTGSASRIGAHGSSWTQAVFRLDGVDITSADGTGTPFLLPGVTAWERVDIATGLMPIEINAPGLAISLTPRRPTSNWRREIEAIVTGPALLAHTELTNPPPTARLSSATYGSALFSGPIGNTKGGMVFGASWNGSRRYERADPTLVVGTVASLFTHLVFPYHDRDEARVIGWIQRSTSPLENRSVFAQPTASEEDRAMHAQLVWDHHDPGSVAWSAFGSFSARQRNPDVINQSSIALERITDGPVETLLYPGAGTETAWSAGIRLNQGSQGAQGSQGSNRSTLGEPSDLREPREPRVPRAPREPWHSLSTGVETSWHGIDANPAFTGRIGERINGLPARIWEYTTAAAAAGWNEFVLAAYASESVELHPRLVIDGGVRLEHVLGSRAGVQQISWTDLLPRGSFRWKLPVPGEIVALAGYSRTAHRLVLSDLAWGDPAAPIGNVYRWIPSSTAVHAPLASERGALVARVGPGGAGGFASIDPELRRPHMDELTFGFEARPRPATVFRLVGMGRRERNLIAAVDTGVPESAYSVVMISDPGLFGDGQRLPVFNRVPATFGLDRYSLTNPLDHETTFVGAELTGQFDTRPVLMLFGLTAGRSEGLSANRGFRAIENDAALVGELYTDPNARTYAQGRLFTERGYTIKWSGVYRLPYDFRFGWTARYQDGQHFARLIVVPNLNQGPEIVRAFRNGRTRFTFTATLDARLQKEFAISSKRLTLVLDGYNLLNTQIEIEEFQVGGPLSRTTTAVQPPRALHAGLKIAF